MPTRPSMQQLSNIWTNPYGGTPQNELNVAAGDDATRYHMDLLRQENARLANERLAEQNRQLGLESPAMKRYQKAEDMNYDVGLFNSPLGYQNRQMLDVQAEDVARRLAPEWQHEIEKADVPWRRRESIAGLQVQGDIDEALIRGGFQESVAEKAAWAKIMGIQIMAQAKELAEWMRQHGNIAGRAAGVRGDVQGPTQSFNQNVPRPQQQRKKMSSSELHDFARENKMTFGQALDYADKQGWDVIDDQPQQ